MLSNSYQVSDTFVLFQEARTRLKRLSSSSSSSDSLEVVKTRKVLRFCLASIPRCYSCPWQIFHHKNMHQATFTLVLSTVALWFGHVFQQPFEEASPWPRRRQWHPTPVLLLGKSHGWRSLVGCSTWDRKESETTERLHFHFSLSCTGEGNGNPLQCSCLENPRDRRAW